jgi:hypothetical protein
MAATAKTNFFTVLLLRNAKRPQLYSKVIRDAPSSMKSPGSDFSRYYWRYIRAYIAHNRRPVKDRENSCETLANAREPRRYAVSVQADRLESRESAREINTFRV